MDAAYFPHFHISTVVPRSKPGNEATNNILRHLIAVVAVVIVTFRIVFTDINVSASATIHLDGFLKKLFALTHIYIEINRYSTETLEHFVKSN